METQTQGWAGGYAEKRGVSSLPIFIFSFFHFYTFSAPAIMTRSREPVGKDRGRGRFHRRSRALNRPLPIRPLSVLVQDVNVREVACELAVVESVANDEEIRDPEAHVIEP